MELNTLSLQVELLESALVTNGEAEAGQYQDLATSGNEWLEAIGAGDVATFTLPSPATPQATPDAGASVFTVCSDRYPDSQFYVDFGVNVDGDTSTLVSVYVDAQWPEGQAAPIYLLITENDSGRTELMSAVAAEHTFEVPVEWSDTAAHDYAVWIGEPKYGSASFADATPRASDEPVTCDPAVA